MAAGTASWATNVRNEIGQVLQCIIKTSESAAALQNMADGLTKRYKDAAADPPRVLYTDRDCCSGTEGRPSKYQILFSEWNGMLVRLDIFHFLRRFAVDVTSESHHLYATFMSRLSNCIFEWDSAAVELLHRAKCAEMVAAGIPRPSEAAVRKAVSKQEMSRHCRRCTRDSQQISQLIEALLLELSTARHTGCTASQK